MKYIKTYKTNSNHSVIKLKYADVDVECHFVNGNIRIGQWAKLRTSNEIVQRAIESSNLFGRIILPDGEPIALEDEKKPLTPEEVTDYKSLRNYLVAEHGIDRTKISSPNAMKAKVKELGLEFPNMQW